MAFLLKNVRVDKHIQPGVRVTVMMEHSLKKGQCSSDVMFAHVCMVVASADPKYFVGKVVSPSIPRMEAGTYWGYRVRFAHSLGAIFTESPFEVSEIFASRFNVGGRDHGHLSLCAKGGYDLSIGTAENGDSVDDVRCLPQFR